jgi:hypothetical protein
LHIYDRLKGFCESRHHTHKKTGFVKPVFLWVKRA